MEKWKVGQETQSAVLPATHGGPPGAIFSSRAELVCDLVNWALFKSILLFCMT